MHGVASRVETGKHIEWNGGIGVPAIGLRNSDKLGPGAGTIHADALRVRAKMPATRQTIPAMPAGDVTFADDEVAFGKTFHVVPDKIDNSNKFMTDGHRHGDRLLGPRVPVIYMYVRSADRGLEDTNEHIVAFGLWNRHLFEPKPRLGLALDDSLHRFLHGKKLSADFADSRRFPESRCRN